MEFDNTKILFKKNSLKDRLFFEMVGIVSTPNAMNLRSDVDGLSVTYSYLFNLDYCHRSGNNDSDCALNFDTSELIF